MRNTLAAAVLFLCTISVSAGTITSLDPPSFRLNSGEHFVTVYGSGLGNRLIFDGPAGHFERDVNAVFTGSVVGWVPEPIIQRAGTYSLIVRGSNGDSGPATFTVVGVKVFPLVIFTPEVLWVQPRTREGVFVKYDVFAAGGDDPEPVVKCDRESGSFFPMGNTTVTCFASNRFGEKAEASFVIDVTDREAPIVKVPDRIEVKASSREGEIVEFDTAAFDEIYGELPAECLPKSGSMFPHGTTAVQCSATDLDLNTGYGTFEVHVEGDGEKYQLTVLVPENLSVKADNAKGMEVKFEVAVKGTDDPRPTVTCNPSSGSLFPLGETEVRCDALDAWGARGSASFSVNVFDPEPPVIFKAFASPDVLTPADGRIVPVRIGVDVIDDLDEKPSCFITSVTSNERIDLGDNDKPESYNWRITGDLELELRARVDRASERYYDVWIACSDFFGNLSMDRARVTVPKSSAGQEAGAETSSRTRSVRH
jgi:hypothetical protein